jgi:hypothetical protein
VAHSAELVAYRSIERRMGVTVDGRPPRRHPIDQGFAIGELETNTGG